MPAPVPNYTMIEIPDPPSCYALKVSSYGYMYYPTSGWTTSEDIVYSPNYSSVWNMSGKYSDDYLTTVNVYVKWTSSSGWSYIGSRNSSSSYVTKTCYGYFLSKMEFLYDELLNP